MRLFFTLFEAPWCQWPLHCVYNEKLKKAGPEKEKERLEQPSCLQQGWGNNVFYNKLSHVLTFTFSVKLSRCNASLCTRCFRYFSSFHFFAHRYVYLENHFLARQDRSTGNPTLHQETSTNVWSALIALRDKSLLSRAAVLFHTKLQLTV